MSVRAGFAVSDITPRPGLPMGGYAARSGVAAGTLDRLECRAAVLSSGGPPIALVVLDLLYLSAPWADTVRQRVADRLRSDASHVLIAATHTHSGPAVFTGNATARLSAYEGKLAFTVEATVARARESMEPVMLFVGAEEVEGVSASRRDPAETIDRQVRVLAARRADGSCAGVISSFGCHPTVLSAANLHYSRDLFGCAADDAAAKIGAPVLLFNGAAADVSTRFTRRDASIDEVTRLGQRLGSAIASAVRGARALEDDAIAGRCRTVGVQLRRLPNETDAEAHMAEAASAVELQRARGASAAAVRLAVSRLEGAVAQLHFARQGGWESVLGRTPDAAEVQDLRVCGYHVLAAPGEIFSATGHRLCRGRRALFIGYANDYLGYLVPPERAADGEYEALMAALEPGSVAAIEDTLEELADG